MFARGLIHSNEPRTLYLNNLIDLLMYIVIMQLWLLCVNRVGRVPNQEGITVRRKRSARVCQVTHYKTTSTLDILDFVRDLAFCGVTPFADLCQRS